MDERETNISMLANISNGAVDSSSIMVRREGLLAMCPVTPAAERLRDISLARPAAFRLRAWTLAPRSRKALDNLLFHLEIGHGSKEEETSGYCRVAGQGQDNQ